ncbi:MAG: biotin/lipoyl-binding protein [Candidatus Tectomicrobia bacterium]|nr:biotin/lipoyl-binding protein [Candidatus Tectomicrobia bacterium]
MAYMIQIGEQVHRVEVRQGEAGMAVDIDGQRSVIDVVPGAGRVYSLIVDGRSYVIDVQELGEQRQVHVNGLALVVDVIDEQRRRRHGASGGGFEGEQLISSAMPGKVVKILVEVGQQVTKGQGVIVIEAMKMENELKAPRDGEVKQILVQEGQAVEARAGLLRIE